MTIATYSNGHVKAVLRHEMTRWGISRARLIRRARAAQVTERRVIEALEGNPGWIQRWTDVALNDWVEMIRTSFTY